MAGVSLIERRSPRIRVSYRPLALFKCVVILVCFHVSTLALNKICACVDNGLQYSCSNDTNNGDRHVILQVHCQPGQRPSVSGTVFSGVSAMTLTLQYVSLKDLPCDSIAGSFTSLYTLHTMYVNDFKFCLFKNMKKLMHLIIANTDVSIIDRNVLPRSAGLATVTVERAKLKMIHPLAFVQCTGVTTLKLTDNYLDNKVWNVIRRLASLTSLDLSNNNITEVPVHLLTRHVNLSEMLISGNHIPRLITESIDAPSLVSFTAANCGLKNLQSRAIASNVLKSLDLSGNNLQDDIWDAINALHNLERLDLSKNRLTVIQSQAFLKMKRLSTLCLSKNKLYAIQDQIPFSLQPFEMDLSDNLFTTIDESFYGLITIEKLHLRRNRIHAIMPGTLQSFKNIEYLDLRDNLLKAVPRVEHRMSMALEGNPLHCDCNTLWLRDWTVRVRVGKARCVSPVTSTGYMLPCFPLNPSDNCDYHTNAIDTHLDHLCSTDVYANIHLGIVLRKNRNIYVSWGKVGPTTPIGYRVHLMSDRGKDSREVYVTASQRNTSFNHVLQNTNYTICVDILMDDYSTSAEHCVTVSADHPELTTSLSNYRTDKSRIYGLAISTAVFSAFTLLLLALVIRMAIGRECCKESHMSVFNRQMELSKSVSTAIIVRNDALLDVETDDSLDNASLTTADYEYIPN